MRLRFFAELDVGELAEVFTDQVADQLVALGAGVSLGLRDFSAERAGVVRRLVDRGVPVDAWLLLPREDGYFATLQNAALVERRYAAFAAWARREGLRFAAVGLDFEPDIRELDAFVASSLRTLGAWAWRARSRESWLAARDAYRALVRTIRGDGHRVDSYQLPTVLDDRRVQGTLLQRVSSGVDVEVDRAVTMLYTSLMGWAGPGLLESYARECQAVAVGSTGGGIDPYPKLTWPQLERDLLLAARGCGDISIFSLEGCVRQGFLPRLRDFDWSRPAVVSPGPGRAARVVRLGLRAVSRSERAWARTRGATVVKV